MKSAGGPLDPDAVRAYAARPWGRLEVAKHEHWAAEYTARGPEAMLAAAHALWVHARAVCPDWPDGAAREADFAGHVELRRRLDRAARAFSRR